MQKNNYRWHFFVASGMGGGKRSLTGEEIDPEEQKRLEAQQKLAEAEAAAAQAGTQINNVEVYGQL